MFLVALWAVPDLLCASAGRAGAGASWRLNRAAARRSGIKVRVLDADGGGADPIGDLFSTLLIGNDETVRLTLICGDEDECRAAADRVMATSTLQIVRGVEVLRRLDVRWSGSRTYGLRFLGPARLLDLTGRIGQ